MVLNFFKNKDKAHQKQIEMKIKRIEYVLKFGNGQVSEIVPIFYGSDLNAFKFPANTTYIELYRQYYRDANETANRLIKEETLELKARFFNGEYIPYLEALAMLEDKKLDLLPLNKDQYLAFENLVNEMINNQNIGIVITDGIPHIADANNTYIFNLNKTGKIEKFAPIESLEIDAQEKYSSMLNGNTSQNKEVKARSVFRMQELTDFVK